jgi:hypothetical protein
MAPIEVVSMEMLAVVSVEVVPFKAMMLHDDAAGTVTATFLRLTRQADGQYHR